MHKHLQDGMSKPKHRLTHFWHKRYPDLVNRWMDLGSTEFTQTYQTGPIDRAKVHSYNSKKSVQMIKLVKNESILFIGTVRVLVLFRYCTGTLLETFPSQIYKQ